MICTENLKKLPVGFDDFKKIRENHFYYVDKTQLIEHLLQKWGEVNLFTRPRRFGKTLNMSMLKNFFEIGTDETLFEGLYISENQKLCEEYMGKYPVIFLSMKDVDGLTYDEAENALIQLIGSEAARFPFLLNSDNRKGAVSWFHNHPKREILYRQRFLDFIIESFGTAFI